MQLSWSGRPSSDNFQIHALSQGAVCRPWLLEVNHSPSFTTDMAVDRRVKEALLRDTLQLVGSSAALSHESDHKAQGHCHDAQDVGMLPCQMLR